MNDRSLLIEIVSCVPQASGKRQDSSSEQLSDIMALGKVFGLNAAVNKLSSIYDIEPNSDIDPVERYEIKRLADGSELTEMEQLVALGDFAARRGHQDGQDLIKLHISKLLKNRNTP